MQRDPVKLTTDDLDYIVSHYKQKLQEWQQEKKTKPKGKRQATGPSADVNLDDLGL